MEGLDSLMKKLERLGGSVPDALGRAIEVATLKAEAIAKSNAPASKHSQADSSGGITLRASITHEVNKRGDAVEGRVFSNAGYAACVEFGTGPVGASNNAGISPNVAVSYTSRKFWVYPTVIKGKETFVTTSGQPARPFLYPTALEMKEPLKVIARAQLLAAIQEAAK